MNHHSLKMYDYHKWANNQVISRIKELPESVYHKEIQSVFPSVAKTLTHIYRVDSGWLGIMSGKGFEEAMQSGEEKEPIAIHEMQGMFSDLSERYQMFFSRQSDMERIIEFHNPWAGPTAVSLSDIVIHVVNHGTYHRGNLSAMLRQLDHSTVMTDYAVFWYANQPN
jgi:uncharacterized damage-inducible protein DinB